MTDDSPLTLAELIDTTKAIEAACGVTNDGSTPVPLTGRQALLNLTALSHVACDHLSRMEEFVVLNWVRTLLNDIADSWEKDDHDPSIPKNDDNPETGNLN